MSFTALDYALALHERGLSVIPVPRPDARHDGKVPAITWKRYQSERATEAQIREWFEVEQNIAIITGALSGVVVIDTDSLDAEDWARLRLPRTPWRTRTSKGFHRFYRHPGTEVRNRVRIETGAGRPALDVRGDGGFVVGPSSVHASGSVYTAVGDWSVPVAKLPVFWLGWVACPKARRPARPAQHPAGLSSADVVGRARAYLAAIPAPVIGQGSDAATFGAACRLVRGFALDASISVDLLQAWAPSFDRWWLEEKVASALKYGAEPERGLLEAR